LSAVLALEDGRIVERGSPEQVLSAPEAEETRRFLARLLSADRI
jgi:ABC-type histidine transport system ATPase subunit